MMKCILAILLSASLFGKVQDTPAAMTAPKPTVVILGGGIGALTSSLYLSRAGFEPIVIEGRIPGGALTQSHLIENWPGEMGIDGASLTDKIRHQVKSNGAKLFNEEVIKVDFSDKPFLIITRSLNGEKKERELYADACIIAMGATPNYLGIPGETGAEGYWGRGVSNCAICDGSFYRDQVVGVVGGGDSAVLEALYLSKLAKEVHIFVRKESFRAKEVKRLRALLAMPNVKVHYSTQIEEVQGNGHKVTRVALKTENRPIQTIALDGIFLAIGSKPNSEIFENQLELDEKGYIIRDSLQQTSVEGVYAIGDIVDPVYKQAISAAGDGCKAALQLQELVSEMESDGMLAAHSANREVLSSAQAATEHKVVEITTSKHFENELRCEQTVVVDFYATWCTPCKILAPLFEYSAQALDGRVKFLKVNVDKCSDLSREYGIRAMPTVLVFDSSGKLIDRKEGTDQIATLLKKLEAQN